MPLPEGFDNVEHLQKTWNQEHNRRVDRYFKDVQGSGDLSGVRPSLKLACRALDNTLFLDAKKGITYTCGNKSASYTDPEHGFAKGNYLLVNSKADAENIYSKMCNAIDVPFKGASHIILNDPDKPSTTTATAGKTTILGKLKQNRRYRPVAMLRFRYAYVSLGNLIPPIFLIDTTLRNQSLVKWL